MIWKRRGKSELGAFKKISYIQLLKNKCVIMRRVAHSITSSLSNVRTLLCDGIKL